MKLLNPNFSKKATLEQVLAVTMEDLTEFDWHDYLSEEMYEDALESYMEQLTSNVAGMENADVTREMEEERQSKQENYSSAAGGFGKSLHLCGTEFWKNVSERAGREADKPADVP